MDPISAEERREEAETEALCRQITKEDPAILIGWRTAFWPKLKAAVLR
jgi:hypothetical protein